MAPSCLSMFLVSRMRGAIMVSQLEWKRPFPSGLALPSSRRGIPLTAYGNGKQRDCAESRAGYEGECRAEAIQSKPASALATSMATPLARLKNP